MTDVTEWLRDDEGDFDPLCDITGKCEPHEEEAGDDWASCRHCGGWRKRDHPFMGNWGIPG